MDCDRSQRPAVSRRCGVRRQVAAMFCCVLCILLVALVFPMAFGNIIGDQVSSLIGGR